MDRIHKILKELDHNRWSYALPLLGLILAFGIIGCRAKTDSILNPGEQVTRTQLSAEVSTLNRDFAARAAEIDRMAADLVADRKATGEKVDIAGEDLTQQEQLRVKIIQTIGALAVQAAEGTVTPAGAIGTLIALGSVGYGLGKTADIKRKDTVIANNNKTKEVTPAANAVGGQQAETQS